MSRPLGMRGPGIDHSAQADEAAAAPWGCCGMFDWRLRMTWTTPTATDFRFGFEITLYISAR